MGCPGSEQLEKEVGKEPNFTGYKKKKTGSPSGHLDGTWMTEFYNMISSFILNTTQIGNLRDKTTHSTRCINL